MYKCEEARELFSLYIDGMLEQEEERLLKEHLESCPGCSEEMELLREMVAGCRAMEEKEPPEYLAPLVMHRVRKEALRTGFMGRLSKRVSPKFISVAAAAILVLAVATSALLPGLGSKRMLVKEALPPSEEEYVAYDEGNRAVRGEAELQEPAEQQQGMAKVEFSASMKAEPGMSGQDTAGVPTGDGSLPVSRKIIKNAELSLEVVDFEGSFNFLLKMAEEMGGYVEVSSVYTRKYRAAEEEKEFREGHAVLRIPADRFNMAIGEITSLGKVIGQSVTGSDVTLQYMDVKARLESKQVQEERLLEILGKASKIEDILRIENELNRVRAEIEMYMSQLKNWDNLVQYSTVRVTMKEVEPKDKELTPPRMNSLWSRVKRGFIITTNWIIDLLEAAVVGIGYMLPVIIIIGIGFLVWLFVKNINRKGGING